jgi:hypothetical protein
MLEIGAEEALAPCATDKRVVIDSSTVPRLVKFNSLCTNISGSSCRAKDTGCCDTAEVGKTSEIDARGGVPTAWMAGVKAGADSAMVANVAVSPSALTSTEICSTDVASSTFQVWLLPTSLDLAALSV